MPKDELQKHTLNLRAGDFTRLYELHPELDPSAVIRQLVADHVDKMTKKVLEGVDLN